MTERKDETKTTTQCHFISNTHWDREWRFSMQRTRHMLVYMMDMLLDIFEKEPQFKSFHLDSQTVPIQDYLEIRPEKKEIVTKLIEEKKLLVGPWYCLLHMRSCVPPRRQFLPIWQKTSYRRR